MHKNNYVCGVVCTLLSLILVSCSTPIMREEIERQPVRLDDFLTEALMGEDPTSVVLNDSTSSVVSKDNTAQSVMLKIPQVNQMPTMPNGCEVASLAGVLLYYGIDIEAGVLAAEYLPTVPYIKDEVTGLYIGGDPEITYTGSPFDSTGFYCYPEVLVKTCASLKLEGLDARSENGATVDRVKQAISEGIPVIFMYSTDGLNATELEYSWMVKDSSKTVKPYANSHTMIASGYSDTDLFVMDPLGKVNTISFTNFTEVFDSFGGRICLITYSAQPVSAVD